MLGARVDVSYAAPLGNSLALQLGIAFLPAISDAGGLFPLGVDLAAVATAGPLRIGAGVTSGWLWSSVNDSDDSVRHPRSSVLFTLTCSPWDSDQANTSRRDCMLG